MVAPAVRYRDRIHGDTKISRFSHGWRLLKMTAAVASPSAGWLEPW